MISLPKRKCFKSHLPLPSNLAFLDGLLGSKGGNRTNCGEPGSWHGAGNHRVTPAHGCTQISSCAAPGARVSLKVSLVITIAVGGLARPVSPKNQGVDSQADESRKAQLVPPLCFAVQGLCHSRAAQLGGHCPEQPEAAE